MNRIKSKNMSYGQEANQAVNNVIQRFIEQLAKKYNLDKKELYTIWDGNTDIGKVVEPEKKEEDEDVARLMKCSATELKNLCKKQGHKCSGNKSMLVARLLNKEVVSPKNTISKATQKQAKPDNIVKQIQKKVPTIQLRRNKYGNFEHPETTFVFTVKGNDKEVIGKQQYDDEGTILELNTDDIELCNKFKFHYVLPDNLDKNKNNLDDVDVDELDSDDKDLSEEIVIEGDDDDDEIEVEEYEDDFDEEYYEDDD